MFIAIIRKYAGALGNIVSIVIDTEVNSELSTLPIVNSHGKLIYEYFSQEYLNSAKKMLNIKIIKLYY